MSDPFNQLPTDPEWMRKFDALGDSAAKELDCMVLIIAVQEFGKLAISVDGIPDDGPLAELAKDVPMMLITLARAAAMQEEQHKTETRQ